MNEINYFKTGYENFCKANLTARTKKEMKELINQFYKWCRTEADEDDKEVIDLKQKYHTASLAIN